MQAARRRTHLVELGVAHVGILARGLLLRHVHEARQLEDRLLRLIVLDESRGDHRHAWLREPRACTT